MIVPRNIVDEENEVVPAIQPMRVELLNAEEVKVRNSPKTKVASRNQHRVEVAAPKDEDEFSENSYDSNDILEAAHDQVYWSDIEFANRAGASRKLFSKAKEREKRIVVPE